MQTAEYNVKNMGLPDGWLMSIKRTLIKGTFLLTMAGMISRLIGFYYRIFLTHTIGAEGIGIYQLIFPVYTLCFSLTAAGIQTTISRLVAANDMPQGRKTQWRTYQIGLALSFSLSIITALILYQNADWIAVHFIREPRCGELLRILALAIPLGSIHSSACGYYYGIKNAAVPAVTQLIEQIVRVAAVYLIANICIMNHQPVSTKHAVWGLVLGEASSMLVSLTAIKCRQGRMRFQQKKTLRDAESTQKSGYLSGQNPSKSVISGRTPSKRSLLSLIVRQSTPLTANRLCINLLQSMEAILIPSMLKLYGLATDAALSTYGILTGMALPLVLFPSALTNSVSVMLLPTIAEAQAKNHAASIRHAIETSMKYCLLLGFYCTGTFLFLGDEMGKLLFHSADAGKFIVTLAWICPFMYITQTLGSVVHGLGKTLTYFLYNCGSLLIRIAFVVIMIPKIGILGYLWGVLASQLVLTLLLWSCLNRDCKITFYAWEWIVKPAIAIGTGIVLCRAVAPMLSAAPWQGVVSLGIKGLLITVGFGIMAVYLGILDMRSIQRNHT